MTAQNLYNYNSRFLEERANFKEYLYLKKKKNNFINGFIDKKALN